LVGVACALRPIKQLEHLFDVAERVRVPGLRVVLAGGPVRGFEHYAETLIEAGRRKLGDRLAYLGHLEDIRGLCNALDVWVNTSREEACSISILEALASGSPVVGYPSVSVAEQVLPGGGEMVGQDRTDELAAALNRWLSDRPELAARREGARRRAEEDYDIRRLADRLWDEYESLLGDAGTGR
jgi:glycosyltransferase involved in cell wall biosynthesis